MTIKKRTRRPSSKRRAARKPVSSDITQLIKLPLPLIVQKPVEPPTSNPLRLLMEKYSPQTIPAVRACLDIGRIQNAPWWLQLIQLGCGVVTPLLIAHGISETVEGVKKDGIGASLLLLSGA